MLETDESQLNSAPTGDQDVHIRGVGVAPGVAIGPVYVFAKDAYTADKRSVSPDEVADERERFEQAVERSEKDLRKIASVAREKIGDESADIFDAQAMMLRDEAIYAEVVERIEQDRCNADYAVQSTIDKHAKLLEASGNHYLRERVNDLRDLQNRILRHLQRGKILSKIDRETIVVAENLTAADIILFSRRDILGCALEYGGPTSHVSLMARALEVPAVVSLSDISEKVEDGETVILDGFANEVILNPSNRTIEKYRAKQERYEHVLEEQRKVLPLPPETQDGTRYTLMGNIEFNEELPLLEEYRAEGIGLFRTEVLALAEGELLDEEEQFEIYSEVVDVVSPDVVTIRVLDLGGDKMLPMAHREHNPFLGWRGLRILLDRPELLKPQLRAILRAGTAGDVRILLPMVSTLREIHAFYEILEEVKSELDQSGISFARDVPVGIMVEVPAVALRADHFAERVEFFSIGTNDLTQYALAVDRGNDMVSDLYHELHPAVLRLISETITAADAHNIDVSLCGEMAAQPRAAPILFGLGLRKFSASPTYLPEIKRVLRALSTDEAEDIAQQALKLPDAEAVEDMMDDWLSSHEVGVVQALEVDGDNGT